MNRHENINKLLVDFALGELSQQQETEVKTHLAECPQCSSELRRLEALLECTERIRELSADKQMCVSAKQAILASVESEEMKQQTTRPNISPAYIWRIIMKSPITKLATAAVVIIAFILSITLSDKTVAPAFGMNDVLAAMAKAEWLHRTWEFTEINTESDTTGQEIRESWTSINPRREITIYKNGSIEFTEFTKYKMKVQRYDPQTQVLTITNHPTLERKSYASIEDMVLGQLLNLEKIEAKVEYAATVYDGNPAKIIKIDNLNENGVHQKFSIVADVETYLPKLMTYHYESADQSATANVTFNYPKTGPSNIYQAGVPHDAEVKVIDHRPSPEFLEAVKPYRAARENLPQQRIVVDIENEINGRCRVCVIYINGSIQRFERLMWVIDDMPPNTDDFDTILDWARSARSEELGIQLFDGDVVYRVNRDYRNRWTNKRYSPDLKHPEFVVGGLIHRGWPRIGNGQIVHNDYSSKNNLLCIATSSGPRFKGNKLIEPAEETLYYIDPERDYICVRIEAFGYLTPPYGKPEIDDLSFEPSKTPTEPYWVTKVTKFGQTDTGQWYPKEITTNRLSWWLDYPGNTDTPEDEKFVIRLYLDSKPEFPDGIFDPESLPHVGK